MNEIPPSCKGAFEPPCNYCGQDHSVLECTLKPRGQDQSIAALNDKLQMNDRTKTLETISGLKVTHRKEKGQNVFDFYHYGRCVKTCFTYDKAKLFAEGTQFGKDIAKLKD